MWFDETGLPWINPSPNMRSLAQATLYPGVGLVETTNVSVGRGTDTPFEVVGAPWINDLEKVRTPPRTVPDLPLTLEPGDQIDAQRPVVGRRGFREQKLSAVLSCPRRLFSHL